MVDRGSRCCWHTAAAVGLSFCCGRGLIVRLDGRLEHAPKVVGEGGYGLAHTHPDEEHLDQCIIFSHAISCQKGLLHLLIRPSYLHTPIGEPLLAGEGLVEMLPLDVVCDEVSFVVGPDCLCKSTLISIRALM